MKYILFVTIFFTAFTSYSFEQGVVKDPVIKNSSGKSSYAVAPYLENTYQFKFQFGTTLSTYSLSGTGFGTSVPFKRGELLFGLEALYLLDSGQKIYASIRRWSVKYGVFSGFEPSSFFVKTTLYSLGAILFPWENTVGVFAGITGSFRDSVDTSPKSLVTSMFKHGFEFGGLYETEFFLDDFLFKSKGSLFFPIIFSEGFKNTGYFNFSLIPEINVGLFYQISEYVLLGFSPWVRYDFTKFKGEGLRGVSQAEDVHFTFAVPLELQVNF